MTPSRSQKAVRIYAADYELLLWRQANAVQNGQAKPSFAELIHRALAKLAEDK